MGQEFIMEDCFVDKESDRDFMTPMSFSCSSSSWQSEPRLDFKGFWKAKLMVEANPGRGRGGGLFPSPSQMQSQGVPIPDWGGPRHHKAMCVRAKKCFICKSSIHRVETYHIKKRPHHMAKYIGSAPSGLGFYHLELSDLGGNSIGMLRNCGVLYIESDHVCKEDLAKEFYVINKTNWPWQVREIDEDSFLVKFPPHISVEQVAGYPCFGLPSMDVTVKVEVWKEELAKLDELVEMIVELPIVRKYVDINKSRDKDSGDGGEGQQRDRMDTDKRAGGISGSSSSSVNGKSVMDNIDGNASGGRLISMGVME
ncbi:Anthocyanin 5-aromatic acyltransferase [Hordeum vulgare]|nr:Anthocyanin 5-aromatic acyltransferase [Hordeum vulgare]